MPEVNTMGFQVDRATAKTLITAITYVPSVEETVYAESLLQAKRERKAAKKAAKSKAFNKVIADDAASVNSFGSTVSLLKRRFGRKNSRS